MKLQEIINKINSSKIVKTEYTNEQVFGYEINSELEKLTFVDSLIEVYKHEDGFMGVRYIRDQFSEQSAIEDHYWTLSAFEMEEIKTITYREKR